MASCGSQSEPSHGWDPLFQPCTLCSGHLAPSWSQKKPFPAPNSHHPLPGAIFLAPSRTGLVSLQMLPPSQVGPPQPFSLPSPCLLPSHYLASLVACLLSVSSLWNRSFTSRRPGCLGCCRGLSKDALRSASLTGGWGAVCRGCGLLWCSVTCSKYSFIKISYWC